MIRMVESMVDSVFLGLARACKQMDLGRCENVTAKALHQVYQMIMKGSTNLRKMEFIITKEQYISFLGLIGIIYRGDQIYSKRNIHCNTRQFTLHKLGGS